MEAAIYHFSGTGNSLKIARDIAEKLNEAELIPLAKAEGDLLCVSSKVMGIVFPVYAWGPPAVVMRFLDSVVIDPETYVFAVCTCGGSAGGTLGFVERKLSRKGIPLSSGFVVPMPTNYIVWGGALPEEKQKEMFAAADERVAEIVKSVADMAVLPVEKGSPLSRFFLNAVYRLSIGHLADSDRKFSVDGSCNGCGVCERVCQVGNVTLTDGKPVWAHCCEACLACLQWCPEEAIQYGKKSADRKRYHHPEVKASELM